MVEKVSS